MMNTMLRDTRPARKQMFLDPRTKILLCLTVSSVMLSSDSVGISKYLQPFLAAVPLFLILILGKPLIALYYAAMYLIASTVPYLLLPYLPAVVNLLFTGMIAMCTKLIPGMSMFCFLVLTTSVSEFIAAMDRMHVPKKFSVPVSVMFRFFPTIQEEYRAIHDAMKLRNIGSFRNPAEMLEYRMVPLLMSIVSIGNDLSASAMTRGLNAPVRRVNICPIGFHWQDVLAGMFCAVIIGVFAFSRITGL